MEQYIQQYGLAAVFAISIFEGDVILLLAGAAAHQGLLGFVPAALAGIAGSLLGDFGYYWLGRKSASLMRSWYAWNRIETQVKPLAAKWDVWEIPLSRLVYGTRTASMVFWGTQKMPVPKFLGMDAIGCLFWTPCLVSAGYLSSHGVRVLVGELHKLEHLLLAGVVAAILATVFFYTIDRFRKAAAAAKQHQ